MLCCGFSGTIRDRGLFAEIDLDANISARACACAVQQELVLLRDVVDQTKGRNLAIGRKTIEDNPSCRTSGTFADQEVCIQLHAQCFIQGEAMQDSMVNCGLVRRQTQFVFLSHFGNFSIDQLEPSIVIDRV